MKIKLLIFAMLIGLSASAQFTNFNSYGVQKANAGDSLRLVGSQSGQYLYLPTTKMLRAAIAGKVSKQQNVIYLSDFTDTYTGIDGVTKHNEGSAIVKAYNSITDTTKHYTIYFDNNKIYFPTGFTLEGGSYWKKPNISFIGTKPRYAQDGKSLVSGTVILGTFALFANNLYFDGLGIDVGFTYSANYGFTNGAEAFIPCFNPDQSATTERTNITVKNIIMLQKPNALFHAISMEFANGGVMDNITSLYGYHGQVIKAKNIKYTNGFAYGHHGEGLIVKSDVYAVSKNVSVDGLVVDTLPYGVKYLETVTHRMGVLINPASDQMYNIKLNNISVNGYEQGVMAFGLHNVNGLQIDNLFANNCGMAMSNELISGINVQIGKISAIGTGGAAYGYRQIDGNYTTTIQSISLKNVPYGMSVPNGNVYVQTYVHDGGVGAFDINNAGHIYVGTTSLANLTVRNLGSIVDQPLPQFAGIGPGIIKNNSNGIPSIAVAGTDYVIPSAISNFLPKSAGNTNALTGPLYVDRPNTSLGSQIILSTSLAPDWYFGTDIAGSVNKADFSLYNFGIGVNALNISKSNNEVLISGNLKVGTLIGPGDKAVFSDSDGKLKIGDLSGYQTVSNLSNVISASSTLYPSNNAVINYTTGNFVKQGGNSFGAGMVIGTNDNQDVTIKRNGFEAFKMGTIATFNIPIGPATYQGSHDFSSGALIATSEAFKDGTYLNTLQSNTLTANVNTYLPTDGGQLVNSIYTGTKQVKTASGNGSSTTISIAHGMTGITAASWVSAIANNAASAGIQYVTVDATNVNIIYTVAPVSGTNNLLYSIEIKQ